MPSFLTTLVRFFLTGLATLLPFVVTVFIATWAVKMADAYVGPSSYFGRLINTLSGPGNTITGYFFGYLIVIILIVLLGFLVNRATVSRIHKAIESAFARIPLIGKIHTGVTQLVELFGKQDQSGLERFGGAGHVKVGNVKVFALLSTTTEFHFADGKHLLVFIPNSPIPATGFNMLVPADDFVHMEMSVEEMAKLLMSLGVLGPQVLKAHVHADLKKEIQKSNTVPTKDRQSVKKL